MRANAFGKVVMLYQRRYLVMNGVTLIRHVSVDFDWCLREKKQEHSSSVFRGDQRRAWWYG